MNAPNLTLYGVLGVDRSASANDIQLAFYRKAAEHHPDRGGSHDAMAQINKAYNVLIEPKQRQKYDAELKLLGELCPTCDGAGRTYKQKGFTSRQPIVCAMCGGGGILRWKKVLGEKPIVLGRKK